MKTMDDCGRKYHPGKKDIKGKRNEKKSPRGADSPEARPSVQLERSYD